MTGKNLLGDNQAQTHRVRNSYIKPGLSLLAAACAAVVLTACGGGDDSATSGSSSATEASRASRKPTSPTTPTDTATTSNPAADQIVDASGNLNAAEYVAIGSDY